MHVFVAQILCLCCYYFSYLSAPPVPENKKKARSAIVVSTAADLNQVVSHAKALFAKYNAIAKEVSSRGY